MRTPYRLSRQAHLGDFLDELQSEGSLEWVWSYSGSTAEYTISEPGKLPRLYGTKEAEQLAARYAARSGKIWFPVPPPGGKHQLAETLKRMNTARQEIVKATNDDE